MTGETRPALAAGVRAFLVWKGIGVLWSLAYLVFAIRWAFPRFAHGGPELASMKSTYATELAIDGSEAGLTIVGLLLAWLAYWLFGDGPRALAFSRFWTHPAHARRNL